MEINIDTVKLDMEGLLLTLPSAVSGKRWNKDHNLQRIVNL